MPTGAVARFDLRRGYGFVIPDDGGEDVFVHQNDIIMDGFRYLKEGERVSYELQVGEKGMKAVQVQLLEPRPAGDSPYRNGPGGGGGDMRPRRSGPPGGAPMARHSRSAGMGGDDRGSQDLQRLRRKFERLVSLLVAKGLMQPGDLDAVPSEGREPLAEAHVETKVDDFHG